MHSTHDHLETRQTLQRFIASGGGADEVMMGMLGRLTGIAKRPPAP